MKSEKSYKKLIKLNTPSSPTLKNCAFAFLIGGGICLFGEFIAEIMILSGIEAENAYTLVTVGLIFIASILTGLGVFDNIARFAGAGTLVPVTGFANSVVSPAIDTKSEGFILGVGAKIFTIAGPVILFAVLSGSLLGLIYYVATALI